MVLGVEVGEALLEDLREIGVVENARLCFLGGWVYVGSYGQAESMWFATVNEMGIKNEVFIKPYVFNYVAEPLIYIFKSMEQALRIMVQQTTYYEYNKWVEIWGRPNNKYEAYIYELPDGVVITLEPSICPHQPFENPYTVVPTQLSSLI